mgnify:CR=1 FL=1
MKERAFRVRARAPRLTAVVAATTMAAGLVSSGAKAQTDETYYGCLTPDSLRVDVGIGEAPGGHCAETDTLINWNEVGPQGPKGDQGDNGA